MKRILLLVLIPGMLPKQCATNVCNTNLCNTKL